MTEPPCVKETVDAIIVLSEDYRDRRIRETLLVCDMKTQSCADASVDSGSPWMSLNFWYIDAVLPLSI